MTGPEPAVRMVQVGSTAIRRIGFDPSQRVLVVEFDGSRQAYGYPNLTNDEVAGLVAVLQNGDSLGRYIATVIKPNHDHERIQF